MDLSFTFDRDAELAVLPHDLAALLVGVATRQAASPTAAAQSRLLSHDGALFRPVHGSFNGPMAAAMLRWRQA